MPLTAKEIERIITDALPDFERLGSPKRLEGGNLNYVWRINGPKKNLIAKEAPPYIAANPEVPLSSKRIAFESKVLKQFQQGKALHSLVSDGIRPPQFRYYDAENHLLLMEDVGDLPDIANSLNRGKIEPGTGKTLGTFIGKLHKKTCKKNYWSSNFNNIDIQQTRLDVQYKSAHEYAQVAEISNVSTIRKKTKALGNKLLKPGKCLVMGDLWPPSVLVDHGKLRLIDWEFTHYGLPLQDVGHFAAHCWMQAHTAATTRRKQSFRALWDFFWEGYQTATAPDRSQLFNAAEYRNMGTHIGAEILVRAAGPFKDGYLYQRYSPNHTKITRAVRKARQMILEEDITPLWDSLN